MIMKSKIKKSEKKPLDHARELRKLWTMRLTLIPVVVGALGTVLKDFVKEWKSWKLDHEQSLSKLEHF